MNKDESGFLLLLFGLFYFAVGQEMRTQWLEFRKSQEVDLIIYDEVKWEIATWIKKLTINQQQDSVLVHKKYVT